MATDIGDVNAFGNGVIESSREMGNSDNGVFGQPRPTGVMARGVGISAGKGIPLGEDRGSEARKMTGSKRRVGGR